MILVKTENDNWSKPKMSSKLSLVSSEKCWRPPPLPQYSSNSNFTKRKICGWTSWIVSRHGFFFRLSSKVFWRIAFQGPETLFDASSLKRFVPLFLYILLRVFFNWIPETFFKHPMSRVNPCLGPAFLFGANQKFNLLPICSSSPKEKILVAGNLPQ